MSFTKKKIHIIAIFYLWAVLLDSRGLLGAIAVGDYFNITLSILIKMFLAILFLISLPTFRIKKEWDVPILLFIALVLFSSLTTYLFYPEYTLRALSVSSQVTIDLGLLLLIGKSNLRSKDLNILFYNLLIFIIINTLFVFISYFYPNFSPVLMISYGHNYSRAFGIMGDQLPYLISFFLFYSLLKDNLFLFSFFIVGIILTSSITASFIALMLVLYYILIVKKSSLTKHILLLVFVIISLTITSYSALYNLGVFQRLSSGLYGPQTNLIWRILSFENGIDMFLMSPISGYGYGVYSYLVTDTMVTSISGLPIDSAIKILSTTSNQFLQMLVETGVLGLLAFIYLLYGFYKISFFRDPLPKKDLRDLVLAINGWVIVLPLTALSAVWILPGSFIWILMCILVGISYRIKIIQFGIK